MKNLICLFSILISVSSFGVSFSTNGQITDMTIGKTYVRVKDSNMALYEGCSSSEWYKLEKSEDSGYSEMFSTLLAAKASNSNVHVQLIGCSSEGYAKISHVYNCNNQTCSN